MVSIKWKKVWLYQLASHYWKCLVSEIRWKSQIVAISNQTSYIKIGLPGGSADKNPPAMQETPVWSLGWENPVENGMERLPTPVFWPGEFLGLYIALKNWCFWIVLKNTLESPLDCNKIKPVNPIGNQPWMSIGRTDAEAAAPTLWPPNMKSLWCWERLKVKREESGRRWED